MSRVIALIVFTGFVPATAFAQEADLAVEATAAYDLAGEVDFTVTVQNNGPDDVLDLEVSASFGTETATVVSLEPGCSESAVGVACSFTSLDTPVLESGGERVLSMRLKAAEDAGDARFSVSSSANDSNVTNNSSSVPLIRPVRVDVAIDEHGIDAGARKTLVFDVSNDGPDVATNVRVMGTVTIDFEGDRSQAAARELTGMTGDVEANCGRQVPESSSAVARWTFPVSCSIADLSVGQVVEFDFWFDEGKNALFRLSAVSANLDVNQANNVTDGSFLNSPIEFVDGPDDGGCSSIAGSRNVSSALFCVMALGMTSLRRRRQSRT